MNIFFDVDETILGYDGSLRPLVRETFQALVDDGHRIFVWSGVRSGAMVRSEVVQPHALEAYVTDCFQKPRFDYLEQWRRTGIDVQPDFCVDDYPEVIEAFGGILIRPYARARPEDADLERVYAAIQSATSANGARLQTQRRAGFAPRPSDPAHSHAQGDHVAKEYPFYKAEYIWVDGTQPVHKLRSKTKIVPNGHEPPVWGFDGSSTQQATGDRSDCVLRPVFVCDDPIRGGDNKLVMCEVELVSGEPHPSNTRAACREMAKRFERHDTWFGMEQEYTLFDGIKPLGWPDNGFPAPQGGYYCGVGADEVFGRPVVEAHLENCLKAGLSISGINAEVMPGQWEFQVGPLAAPLAADQHWVARWLLYRTAEDFPTASGNRVSAKLDPKPVKGDWNGAGCHTNFSTKEMRENYDACIAAAEALGTRHDLHIANYGVGIEERLTGLHETASWREFSYGVSHRGASVRIPWQVAKDKQGYIEDRRPNANMDPYVVTRLIIETVCGTAEGQLNANAVADGKAAVAR